MSDTSKAQENNDDNNTSISCSICEEAFENINQLEGHVREHFKEDQFSCPRCDKQYVLYADYTSHVKKIHRRRAQYLCRYCDWIGDDKPHEFIEHEATHFPGTDPFDCFICGDGLKNLEQLHGHKKHCSEARIYSCKFCEKTFSRRDDLHIHQRQHENATVYECKFCSKPFLKAKNFGMHIKNSHKKKIDLQHEAMIEYGLEHDQAKFMEVIALFNTSEKRQEVYSALTQNENILKKYNLVRKYACPICKLAFVKMNTLVIHCRLNHLKECTVKELGDIEKHCDRVDNFDSTCTLCKQTMKSIAELRMHLRKEHNGLKPYKCSICNLCFFRPSTLVEHIKTHANDREKCKYCWQIFNHVFSLMKHVRIHEGDNIVNCPTCNIPYSNENSLKKHERMHCEGKPYKCDYCDKCFVHASDKNKHVRIHTGEKPHKCDQCGKAFAISSSLKKHAICHSDSRIHQCTICGATFKHKSNLVVHHRTHTGVRPYKCETCGKTFLTCGHLTEHKKIHTGQRNFKCNECGKNFVFKHILAKHMRIHNGEKPYQCLFCSKSFSQQSHLTVHLRTHTGEKPYTCDVCEKKFYRSDSLASHRRVHLKIRTYGPKHKKKTPAAEVEQSKSLDDMITLQEITSEILSETESIKKDSENHLDSLCTVSFLE